MEIRVQEAALRLRPVQSGVALEITHGPADGSVAWWLDLYTDPPQLDFPSLHECIVYGLELMKPSLSKVKGDEQGAALEGHKLPQSKDENPPPIR